MEGNHSFNFYNLRKNIYYISSILKQRLSISYLERILVRIVSTFSLNSVGLKFLRCRFTSATNACLSSA